MDRETILKWLDREIERAKKDEEGGVVTISASHCEQITLDPATFFIEKYNASVVVIDEQRKLITIYFEEANYEQTKNTESRSQCCNY